MDTVERVLHATMGNEVAKLHNWNGMKGKKALKNLELSKVMFGSVKIVFYLQYMLMHI